MKEWIFEKKYSGKIGNLIFYHCIECKNKPINKQFQLCNSHYDKIELYYGDEK